MAGEKPRFGSVEDSARLVWMVRRQTGLFLVISKLFLSPSRVRAVVVNQGCKAERGLGGPHKNNFTRLETEKRPKPRRSFSTTRLRAKHKNTDRPSASLSSVRTCGESATCLEGFPKSPFSVIPSAGFLFRFSDSVQNF